MLRHLATSAEDAQWLPAGVAAMVSERRSETLAFRERTTAGVRTAPRPVRRRALVAAATSLAVGCAAWATLSFQHPSGHGGAGAAGAAPTNTVAPWNGDPCDLTSHDFLQRNQLTSVGQHDNFTDGSAAVQTCTWRLGPATTNNKSSMTLAYSKSPFQMISDRKAPQDLSKLDLTALDSGSAYADHYDRQCEVSWQTPGGYAAVVQDEPDHTTDCSGAAALARDLSPRLAGKTKQT